MKEVQKATVHEKLGILTDEIEEGIMNISDSPRNQINNEIEIIREISYQERAPEAEYAIRLFRKYATIAQSLKSSKGSGRGRKERHLQKTVLEETQSTSADGAFILDECVLSAASFFSL